MKGSRNRDLAGFVVVALAAVAPAQDGAQQGWPEYRGPHADGHAPGARVPLEWSETQNVRWKTAVRGRGWSSPVVWGGKVWLTSATDEGHRQFVVALDAKTGEKLVERTLFEHERPAPRHRLNSYASPSPVIEDGRVYLHFGTYGTVCIDTDSGDTVWQRRDINCDHIAGPGSSPILFDDLLIFNVDGGDVQFVIALDKRTGETRWKTARSTDFAGLSPDYRKAYSTPIVADVDGAPRLISTGAEATIAYDPRSGNELWKLRHARGFSMSSRPVAAGGLVILNTGYMKPRLIAAKLAGEGDVTKTNVVWSYRRNVPTMPSPLVVGERFYMVDDKGIASCLDVASGKRLWYRRIGGQHCASPLYAAGRIYFFDREGQTVAIEPADQYRELARNRIDDGFMATPAVIGNAFILRSETHVYRVEED